MGEGDDIKIWCSILLRKRVASRDGQTVFRGLGLGFLRTFWCVWPVSRQLVQHVCIPGLPRSDGHRGSGRKGPVPSSEWLHGKNVGERSKQIGAVLGPMEEGSCPFKVVILSDL